MPAGFDMFKGPLRICIENPRYFTDDAGKAIYLTGSHTWENLQDFIFEGNPKFDYKAYLDFMQEHKHNFMRMWIWEQATGMAGTNDNVVVDPIPYIRTGPGNAGDGGLKFDLTQWNEEFFNRLRARVIEAGQRGIYVSVMLFEGWSIRKPWVPGDPWKGHPYHRDNNINGVDGDNNGDGVADIHCLEIPEVVDFQKAFIRKVVDKLNDLDNILYEIINEAPGEDRTVDWQVHIIDYVHEYEATKPKQHPVGMTPSGNMLEKTVLYTGPAEWVSPTYVHEPAYRTDPPAADGRKVMLNDTDHLEPQLAIDYKWVWATFLRGLHPIFMDAWNAPEFIGADTSSVEFRTRVGLVQKNMGYSLDYAKRVDLKSMVPVYDLASTRYCLASVGKEYLVFAPDGGSFELDLLSAESSYEVEWFNPMNGETIKGTPIVGGVTKTLEAPFSGSAVAYVYQREVI